MSIQFEMCNYFSIVFVDHMTHGMINMISKVIGIFGVKVLLERLDTNLVSYCVSCYCCKTREYTRAATFTSCLLECDIWKPSMLTINSSRYHYWIHCVLASIGQVNVQFVQKEIFSEHTLGYESVVTIEITFFQKNDNFINRSIFSFYFTAN